MLIAALLLQAAASAAAPPEAIDLGRRLAASGTLASLLPLIVEKDLTDLAAEDPAMTVADREALFTLGRAQADAGRARLLDAMGAVYARELPVADLRHLVAAAEDPAAQRMRALQPRLMMETMATLGPIDLKKDVAAAFCRERGRLCDRD